jgi:hypothetical protein
MLNRRYYPTDFDKIWYFEITSNIAEQIKKYEAEDGLNNVKNQSVS